MARIREELQKENDSILNKRKEKVEKLSTQTGQKQIKRLARERIEQNSEEGMNESDQKLLKKVVSFVNTVWDRNEFPHASDIEKHVQSSEKKQLQKIIGMVNVGAASVKSLQHIAVEGDKPIYVGNQYIEKNKDSILEKCLSKLQDRSEIVLDNKVMSRKEEVKNKNFYQAIARHIQTTL